MSHPARIPVSFVEIYLCKTSAGLKDWFGWLSDRIESLR